jgi:2-iminobutanoate/2-iminopropanoate deaminase
MINIVETKAAPDPIGPYSQAIHVDGLVFVSGQIPVDPATGRAVEGNIAAQTHRVMKNLAAVLGAAGSSLEKVVKTTVFLVSLDDFPQFNKVYGEYLGKARPARATVQVARLPLGVLLEIEAVAVV